MAVFNMNIRWITIGTVKMENNLGMTRVMNRKNYRNVKEQKRTWRILGGKAEKQRNHKLTIIVRSIIAPFFSNTKIISLLKTNLLHFRLKLISSITANSNCDKLRKLIPLHLLQIFRCGIIFVDISYV